MSPFHNLTRASRPSLASWVSTLIFLPLLAVLPGPVHADSDAKALAIAERTLEAMGGQEGWDQTRFLRFNFFGVRQHHWDRYTGRHRLEGKTREGDTYVVVHNLNNGEGQVWLNGEAKDGDEKGEWLERAKGAWVNDTYWLLMPYKLRDPGVTLAYEGEEQIGEVIYDKLLLTFDQVGLTPGDRYWAFINRETGLMDRWAYFLQDWEEGREPTVWSWRGWRQYGSIMLAPERVQLPEEVPLEGGRQTKLGDLAVFDHLADSVFTSPQPVASD